MTELCELAIKYGSDKVPEGIGHSYTPVYHELFKDKRDIKKVLEIGIGFPKWMPHRPNYKTGASLYMWRDYFPQAQIYGADIENCSLINDDRIKSFKCDQSKKEDLQALARNIGNDFDLIIDDGSHCASHQILTTHILYPILKKGGIYIIEDVSEVDRIVMEMRSLDFTCDVYDFGKRYLNDCFIIIRTI